MKTLWLKKKKEKKKTLDSSERSETSSDGEKAIHTRVDFPPEIAEARSTGHDISQALKEKICQFRILYPVKTPEGGGKSRLSGMTRS